MLKGKILGLDFGETRIGVAISDEDQQMAFGRTSVENKSLDYATGKIGEICTSENVIKIVLGLPLNMEGHPTKSTEKAMKFGAYLKAKLNIDIDYHDERLTSVESEGIINTLDMKRRAKKTEIDIIAASLILKNYLDLHREKKGDK